MRRVELARAPERAELARDVPGPQASGPPLLCAGMRLDPAVLARAARSGVRMVWVNDELGEGIDPPPQLDPAVRSAALRTVDRIFAAARRVSHEGRHLDMGVLRDAQQVAGTLAAAVHGGARDGGEAATDPHGHDHALRVAVLGLSIGLPLLTESEHEHRVANERLHERLTLFGAGLLMHDLGKGLAGGRSSGDAGSGDGDRARHAIAGEALMPASLYPIQIRSVLRSHHEHWDGSGLPDHKAGTAIHLLARIAAVADAYDTLVTTHGGSAPLPPWTAVGQIEACAGTRFDPATVAAFADLVLPFPAGSAVVLPDGREGVVVDAHRDDRLRPLVRVPAGDGVEETVADLSDRFSPTLHAVRAA